VFIGGKSSMETPKGIMVRKKLRKSLGGCERNVWEVLVVVMRERKNLAGVHITYTDLFMFWRRLMFFFLQFL
jgi:hypothetical protein